MIEELGKKLKLITDDGQEIILEEQDILEITNWKLQQNEEREKQQKPKLSKKKRKYHKQSKVVDLFKYYHHDGITKTEVYKIIGKKLGIKPNSVRDTVGRYRREKENTPT